MTIEHLKQKAWYRLLKLMYLLFLFIVIATTVMIAWSDSHPPQPIYNGGSLNDIGFIPTGGTVKTSKAPGFIEDLAPALLIELILFELTRRGFYYVATGKVFPRA
jgi:hypothetical protein